VVAGGIWRFSPNPPIAIDGFPCFAPAAALELGLRQVKASVAARRQILQKDGNQGGATVLTTYALHLHDSTGNFRLVPMLAENVVDAMHRSRELLFAEKNAQRAELNIGNDNVIEWNRFPNA
jgi:hypothetical protein